MLRSMSTAIRSGESLRSALLATILLVVSSGCGKPEPRTPPWTPTAEQWEEAMEKIATKHFPATFADSLGWPDTVQASRDFFVTNLNYFAVIHRWQFDSVIWIEPCIGAHRGKELAFIRVGVTYLAGSAAVTNYMRLRANDSLWTLLAETKFWSGGPEVWEDVIRDPSWMSN